MLCAVSESVTELRPFWDVAARWALCYLWVKPDNPTKTAPLEASSVGPVINLHQRMASRGSCQPQTDSSVIERTEGANYAAAQSTAGWGTAEETGSARPD